MTEQKLPENLEEQTDSVQKEEEKMQKKSYRWFLSLAGELLLIVPVIVILIVIGKLFNFI